MDNIKISVLKKVFKLDTQQDLTQIVDRMQKN